MDKRAKKSLIITLSSIAVFTIVVSCFLAWLAYDDAELLYPPDIELYAPQPEGGEESYRRLLEACNTDLTKMSDELRRLGWKKKSKNTQDQLAYQQGLLIYKDEINALYNQSKPNLQLFNTLAWVQNIGRSPNSLSATENKILSKMLTLVNFLTYKLDIDLATEESIDLKPLLNIYQCVEAHIPHSDDLYSAMALQSSQSTIIEAWSKNFDKLTTIDQISIITKIEKIDAAKDISKALEKII